MEEMLYELELTAEAREAEQSEQEASRQERVAREAERVRREGVWRARHPAEWAEWVRVRLLLNGPLSFGDDPFDFTEFLQEVGRRPSPKHVVVRSDETEPYQQGNLTWAAPPPMPSPSPYLNAEEAAAYCRRRPKTLLNHHSLGRVRSMPGTRPPLFRKEDLDDWLTAGRPRRRK